MIALALSLTLIAALTTALLELHQNVRLAVDRAETLDRSRFIVEFIAEAVRWAGVLPSSRVDATPEQSVPRQLTIDESSAFPAIVRSMPFDLCTTPEMSNTLLWPILWLAEVDQHGESAAAPCMNKANLLPESQLIVIDSLRSCLTDCTAILPVWLVLNPGCDPLFTKSSAEVRRISNHRIPADCRSNTAMAIFDRQLLFVRDYAWQKGDGIPALMIKRWLAEDPARWGRAEMLAAGISALQARLIRPTSTVSPCGDDPHCAALSPPLGLELALSLQGWIVDGDHQVTASGSLLSRNKEGFKDGVYHLKVTRTLLRANVGASQP